MYWTFSWTGLRSWSLGARARVPTCFLPPCSLTNSNAERASIRDGTVVLGPLPPARCSSAVCNSSIYGPANQMFSTASHGKFAWAAGLRTNVKRACSQLVRIGGGGTGSSGSGAGEGTLERWAVDSLNVSVASGILLHQLLAKARAGGSQLAADSSGNGAAAVVDGHGGAQSD